jgi:sortase A
MLVMVCVVSVSLLLHIGFVSGLQQRSAQGRNYDTFREQLAVGTAPVGPADADNRALALGTPVAYMEIRSIGLEQVIGEGTTSTVLLDGPGHRRDTPLPGQIGTSVVFGRRAAYGGPFGRIGELVVDDKITVTTGQGRFDFRVISVRRAGDPTPAPAAAGSARLLLLTADGPAYFPNGVLRVDAELVGTPVIGPARALSAATLPEVERAGAGEPATLWALALWMQALMLLSAGAVWGWLKWGRSQAWIVFTPPLLLVGISLSGEIVKLLPNLL